MPGNSNPDKVTTKIHSATDLEGIVSGAEYELAGDVSIPSSWRTLEGINNVSLYGNGHMIRGLVRPLFGNLTQSKIMHLRIEANISQQVEEYTGALVRTGIRVTLSGCSVSGNVSGSGYTGGLAGDLSQSTITNCANVAIISGEQYVGGLAGCVSHSSITANTNSGQIKAVGRAMYGGGILGYAQDESFISDNVNTGPLLGYGFHGVGGIAGGIRDIRVFSGNVNKGLIQGRRFTGGIVGIADASAIEYNHNLAPIDCTLDHVGGIVGYAYKSPVLISKNASAGSVEGQADFVGGVCGYSYTGTTIIENSVSCPQLKGKGSIGRVLGGGEALMSNSRINGQCVVIGPTPPLMHFAESIIMDNNPDLGINNRHGESLVCPEGMIATGIWMHCVPKSQVAVIGNEMELTTDGDVEPQTNSDDTTKTSETAELADTSAEIEAGIEVLSHSFEQIVTSLGLGVTALSRVFQTDLDLLRPMLRRDQESLRTLRLLQSTLNAYMEYCEQVDPGEISEVVDANATGTTPSLLSAKVERIVMKLVTTTTQMPLEDVPIVVAGAGQSHVILTDAEGQAAIEGLAPGTYEVSEQAAPKLYLRDSDTHTLTVLEDGTYEWSGRLGLHWGNLILVTIPHVRDDSALFLHGESWAAHPDRPAIEARIPRNNVERQYEMEPDMEDKAAALEMIESLLGSNASVGAGDPPVDRESLTTYKSDDAAPVEQDIHANVVN